MMKKSTLSLLIGLTLLILGFMYLVVFVNIPYQDPPLYLQQRQAFHAVVGQSIMLIGLVVFGGSLLLKVTIYLWSWIRSSKHTNT
jgi:hypothetical protein